MNGRAYFRCRCGETTLYAEPGEPVSGECPTCGPMFAVPNETGGEDEPTIEDYRRALAAVIDDGAQRVVSTQTPSVGPSAAVVPRGDEGRGGESDRVEGGEVTEVFVLLVARKLPRKWWQRPRSSGSWPVCAWASSPHPDDLAAVLRKVRDQQGEIDWTLWPMPVLTTDDILAALTVREVPLTIMDAR